VKNKSLEKKEEKDPLRSFLQSERIEVEPKVTLKLEVEDGSSFQRRSFPSSSSSSSSSLIPSQRIYFFFFKKMKFEQQRTWETDPFVERISDLPAIPFNDVFQLLLGLERKVAAQVKNHALTSKDHDSCLKENKRRKEKGRRRTRNNKYKEQVNSGPIKCENVSA